MRKAILFTFSFLFFQTVFTMEDGSRILFGNELAKNIAILRQDIFLLETSLNSKEIEKKVAINRSKEKYNKLNDLLNKWSNQASSNDDTLIRINFLKLLDSFWFASKNSGYRIDIFNTSEVQKRIVKIFSKKKKS